MTSKNLAGKTSSENSINIPWLKPILIIGLLVIIFTISLYIHKFGFGLWDKPDQWGQLGDFFGGVLNPLLGFLSLIFLLITLTQNQKALNQNKKALNQNEQALKINSEELALTREEVSGSRSALEAQARILEKQNLEGTFFQLLSLYNEIVSSTDITNNTTEYTGRDAFHLLNQDLTMHFNYPKGTNIKEKINNGYLTFYKSKQNEIGHYFRILYNIIKFIDVSNLDDKKRYTNLLRAQLSSSELRIIFYNCLSEEGVKFKPLIEKYSLLKFLPLDNNSLLFNGEEKSLYENSAYE